MLGSLRDTLASVQNELASGTEKFGQRFDRFYGQLAEKVNGTAVERLRINVVPSSMTQQRCPIETVNELL
ncbi:unnamed protein product, partial [Mesorhabditis spiculigera]